MDSCVVCAAASDGVAGVEVGILGGVGGVEDGVEGGTVERGGCGVDVKPGGEVV